MLITGPSQEDSAVLTYARHWTAGVNKTWPGRLVQCTTQDVAGMTVLITRYVSPQLPPRSVVDVLALEDNEATACQIPLLQRRIARFVAAIPFLLDTVAFVGNSDVWTTSDQLIQMLGGKPKRSLHALCLLTPFPPLPFFFFCLSFVLLKATWKNTPFYCATTC